MNLNKFDNKEFFKTIINSQCQRYRHQLPTHVCRHLVGQTQYVETFKISHHAHVYQSSKAVRRIVDLNVPLMKIALVIWHV